MKYLEKIISPVTVFFLVALICAIPDVWAGKGPGGPAPEDPVTQVFDTSFAVEFSYSCLSGGCHETDQNLVNEYAASKMTHTMVKCNACHGTHTADTVGLEKPNLTGYYPGIGATGYSVDTDRCKSCHNNEHVGGPGGKSGDNCYGCHTPHVFGASGGGGGRW